MSAGMVMCAGNGTNIEFVRPADGSKVGDRVQIDGNRWKGEPLSADYEPVLNPKKKIEVGVLALLKTNADCMVTFNDIKMVTEAGPLKTHTLANCSVS
jgi:hypothetical protein